MDSGSRGKVLDIRMAWSSTFIPWSIFEEYFYDWNCRIVGDWRVWVIVCNKIKEEMRSFILEELVLNDNILLMPEEGKIFSGGYCAIIKEWIYQNPWSNRKQVKRFRSMERLEKYLKKNYPKFDWYNK